VNSPGECIEDENIMSTPISSIDALDALNKRSIRPSAASSNKAAFTQLLSQQLSARQQSDDTRPKTDAERAAEMLTKARPLKPLSLADLPGGRVAPEHATLKTFDPADPRALATKALRPLDELDRIPGVRPNHSPEKDELTKQAEKWVSQTFFGTMLKQMRDSPFKSDLFSGGRGGEAFSQMFDQTLSDRMARGAGGKMVKSIVRALERKSSLATA